MVRALASQKCVPGLIPGLGVVCELSLLLVLVLAPRCFSPGTPDFSSPQKPTFLNSNSIWEVSSIDHFRVALNLIIEDSFVNHLLVTLISSIKIIIIIIMKARLSAKFLL